MLSNSQNDTLYQIRSELGAKIYSSYNGIIQNNTFKGCSIPEVSEWSGTQDLGSKLLGIYEQDVLDFLNKTKGTYKFLVDIGAADGYYVVGSVFAGIVDRAYGFEINGKSRDTMIENAKINNVLDSVYIDSEATLAKIDSILNDEDQNPGIFIIDIEGAEFDLLTYSFLKACKNCTLIVEIHEENDLNNKYKDIINYCSNFFDISYFYNRTKTIPDLPLINTINDNFRWLLCSEGRFKQMHWLVLTPRKSPQSFR
jgi:hypothetical protein